MDRARSLFVAAGILVCLGALTGCDKEVKLTFVNLTSESLAVTLNVPGEGTQSVGVVPPNGGKLPHKVKIDSDDLPATCTYAAGQHSGSFTVNKKTPDKLWIDIRPGGPDRIRDDKTTVHEKRQVDIKDVKVRQEEVVE